MKFLVALLSLAAVASAAELLTSRQLDSHFEQFKNDYDRSYGNVLEEASRKAIFRSNLEFIFRHNLEAYLGRKSFLVAINNYTDLVNDEFRGQFNGYNRKLFQYGRATGVHRATAALLPDTVDWTTHNPPVVNPIKDQGQCGSCWAFSSVASIEGQHALKTGQLVSLSEQNLVDCAGAQGNDGCDGGLMDSAFQYVIDNNGIATEASYPYKAADGSCGFTRENVGATVKSYVDVAVGDESALQSAVATVGPISVAIDASQLSFQFYSSGVYDEPACSTTELDHGVAAVGYGELNGTPYWKVRNSWGTSWGEAGYIRMSRNKQNQCGIATQASYPVV